MTATSCLTVLLFARTLAWAAPVITCDFATPLDNPWLQTAGDARVSHGVLVSRPQANWARSALFIGPLPLKNATWTIAYDVRPVALGAQCQEFVSQTPSTHWYMAYVRPDGRVNLHTRTEGRWELRATSAEPVRVGEWYRVRVELSATSIRYLLAVRGSQQPLWDSGSIPMDDLGSETVCGLVDESSVPEGQTEWDNLVVATDSPGVMEQMAHIQRRMEEERRQQREQAEASRRLRELGIALIPLPRKVELTGGSFLLADHTVIIPDPNHPDAAAQAEMVQAVIEERLGLRLPIGTDGPAGALILSVQPPDAERPWLNDQGYRLQVLDNSVEITAATPVGLFYGAQTLCQMAAGDRRVPQGEIADWPAIPARLVMIAVSQGAFQVIDVEYWKRLIRELAAVKITHIMPYFEGGTFYYEKYPFLGDKGRDGFTIEKGKLLSEYARQHFVELLPQQQCLGHSGVTLLHEELADLRESGDVFCPSNPRTYQFLGDLFDELVQAFPYAHAIHVGGDEFASGFAQCPQCRQRAEQIGKPGLYAEHLMRLREMLAQRGRGMMIWWHEEGWTEEAADKLAKDITIFDWHYGNQASYPSLERLQSLGFAQTWATPAVTRYYDPGNDWDNTFGNISGFLRAGAQRQVPGECTCTWVHGVWGGRNLFELNLYGLVFSANCAWNPLAADYADFRWRFGRHWFGLSAEDLEKQVLCALHAPFGTAEQQGFWARNQAAEEILADSLARTADLIREQPTMVEQARTLARFCERADAILQRWRTAATRNRVTADFLAHDVLIHAALARKILAVHALLEAEQAARESPGTEVVRLLSPAIDALRRLVIDFRTIEEGFERSVLEAGGGRCGWGYWYPFVAKGGVQFRAPQGREETEKVIGHLQQAVDGGRWPDDLLVR